MNSIFETHQISERLNQALRASAPSVKPQNESRASSLLRRSLAWTSILKQSISGESRHNWLAQLFSRISAVDSDAARWLLEQMSRVLGNKPAYKEQLMNICAYAVAEPFAEDVKACAMENLAAILESHLVVDSGSIPDLEIPWNVIHDSMRSDYHAQTQSRETTDAALWLQGCLLTLEARSLSGWELSKDFTLELRKWATKLQYAMKEETVSLVKWFT